jgi:hypothetical protein
VNRSQRSDGTQQHWGMLVFESLSAGAMSLLVAMMAIMLVVGVYVIIVWPLTSWDLSHSGLEKYASWGNTALWSAFAAGSLAGLWCFSGAAFKEEKKKANERTARSVGRGNR